MVAIINKVDTGQTHKTNNNLTVYLGKFCIHRPKFPTPPTIELEMGVSIQLYVGGIGHYVFCVFRVMHIAHAICLWQKRIIVT